MARSNPRRTNANRKNAQKSTGPKTTEGKNRSRWNALTHGLRIDTSTASELLSIAGIDRTLRAQALSLDQWAALAQAWDLRGRPEATAGRN